MKWPCTMPRSSFDIQNPPGTADKSEGFVGHFQSILALVYTCSSPETRQTGLHVLQKRRDLGGCRPFTVEGKAF